ncbi:MAG: formyltransferase [Acidobacteriota bacterium]|nr:formyltransferase [Acidobacteriota bacterium]
MGGIVVCAYSDVGYKCLNALFNAGESVRLVYTHDDAPGEERWFDSVAELAREHGIEPRRVVDLSDPADEERIRAVQPDFLFSFYFRKMIPGRVLSLARRGALNMHGSLLPLFRGRSPVNWAILKGATETGASLHYMTEKPDAGDLVDQERVTIGPDDDVLAVSRRVSDAAAVVLARALPRLKAGDAPRVPLDLTKGSYFGGRKPEDGAIDWTLTAKEIHDLVRAVTKPWPGAFTDVFGKKVTVWKTRLSTYGGHDVFPGKVELTERSVIVFAGDDHTLEILAARPEGGKDLDAGSFRDWLVRPSGIFPLAKGDT